MIGFSAVTRDLTAAKRMEMALRLSDQRFELAAPGGVSRSWNAPQRRHLHIGAFQADTRLCSARDRRFAGSVGVAAPSGGT